MENVFFDENAKNLSKLLLDSIKIFGGNIYDVFKKKEKDISNFLYKISDKYIKRFYSRYGHVQVMGMSSPMSLENIYVDIEFLDTLSNHQYLSLEKLKEHFDNNKSAIRNLQNCGISKIDGINVAQEFSRLIVVGAPGGGKSTYLKKVGITALNSKASALKGYIPILIELKNVDHINTLHSLILQELDIADFPNPTEFLERALVHGKLLLLFDGLDEVASEFENSVIKEIRNFCDKYSKNKFIVSCRVAAYKGGLNNFKSIEIANLDDKQIRDFIYNWFIEKHKKSGTATAEKCLEKIYSDEYTPTLELAQSPLLLTLLCLVFSYQQDFPKNRALLYHDAIQVMLKEWNAEKRIHTNPVYKDMTLPFEELLLSNIANHYFTKNELFFEKRELSNLISEYLNDNLNAPRFLDGSTILEAISIQQGILVERAKNLYSFSHLTFQEYFTAKHIDNFNLIDDYIQKYISDTKWREIFILFCGIAKSGSDKILNSIFLNINKNLNLDSDFKNFLLQLEKFDNTSDVGIQALNLFIILVSITNFNDKFVLKNLQSIIYEIDENIYDKLSHSWIVDYKPNLEMHRVLYVRMAQQFQSRSRVLFEFAQVLKDFPPNGSSQILRDDLAQKLGIGFFKFSEHTQKAISNYISSINFLYLCKKTSIMVSRSMWSKIEQNLFKAVL